MFRENKTHRQERFFNSLSGMDPRFKKRLEKSWAGLFCNIVFKFVIYLLFRLNHLSDVQIVSFAQFITVNRHYHDSFPVWKNT